MRKEESSTAAIATLPLVSGWDRRPLEEFEGMDEIFNSLN
jgi:hypothetical protein